MSEPLRKDEDLTTADIANPARPESASRGVKDAVATDDVIDMRTRQRVTNTNEQAISQPQQPAYEQQQRANPLFPEEELHSFRSRWDKIQTSFVVEPRAAVEQADGLVANVVKRIAEQFASERDQLEKQWDRGENVNTEDLRQALKRYRAFFDRLLTF